MKMRYTIHLRAAPQVSRNPVINDSLHEDVTAQSAAGLLRVLFGDRCRGPEALLICISGGNLADTSVTVAARTTKRGINLGLPLLVSGAAGLGPGSWRSRDYCECMLDDANVIVTAIRLRIRVTHGSIGIQ